MILNFLMVGITYLFFNLVKRLLRLSYMTYMVWEFQPQSAQSPSPSSGREHEGSLKM